MAHAVIASSSELNLDLSKKVVDSASAHSHEHRPDIDGLRAIAILGVLATHTAAESVVPGGLAGVDVFFVISGYLITGIVLRDVHHGSFSLASFYARRVRRLFPALALVLVCTLIVGWAALLPREFQELGRHVLSGAGFALNLVLYHDGGSQTPVLLRHLWSLGVEEQFYLGWPLYVVAILRFRNGRWFVPATLVMTALSLVTCAILARTDPQASFYLPFSRLWELSLGGLLAAVKLPRTRELLQDSRYRLCIELGGAALVAGSFLLLNSHMNYPGWLAVFPTLGTALLIASGPRGWINRWVLSRRVMVWIGQISYPLYLWHFPVLVYLYVLAGPEPAASAVLGAVAGAFLLAWLTFRFLELPIRRVKNWRQLASILCVLMCAIVFTAYCIYTQRITPPAVARDVLQAERAMTEDWLPGTSNAYWTAHTAGATTLGHGPRTAVFIGDHHMQQYFPRVKKLLPESAASMTAVFATRSWCPPLAEMQSPRSFGGACAAFLADAVRRASEPGVEVVVIAYCWRCYFASEEPFEIAFSKEIAALETFMRALINREKDGYLILAGPGGREFDPRWMVERRLIGEHSRVARESPPRAEVERRVLDINDVLIRIAERTGYSVIRPLDHLCGKDTCAIVTSDGEPVFHDAWNLRPSYVEQEAQFIDEVVRAQPVSAAPLGSYIGTATAPDGR